MFATKGGQPISGIFCLCSYVLTVVAALFGLYFGLDGRFNHTRIDVGTLLSAAVDSPHGAAHRK
jgi:hypothetical protein